ncbi:sensor histidine kinase [Nocardia abscessus]|uniref:sensor histidine kinase n=1 Tax=Nocardia abscessus TaxID=120957 RepID=UPI0018954F04|nr:sensor histidine kinase [Nocardia abscessus]MBF6473334.1 sensor histidine kinase [Nocardia abscessus]
MTDRSSVGWDWGVALVVAAVQLVGGTFANMRQTGVHSLDVLGYLLLLAGPVALIWRRVQPVPVLIVVLAVCVAYFVRGYGYGPIFVALVVAFLTAASAGSRWWTYPLVPLGYLALVWPLPALLGRPAGLWQIFALMAWLAVLLLAAEGIRQRKAVLVERKQRAEAARRDEEAQRERRASEERLAIARELHDVLAHGLSMINVQSSVALELLDKRPEQAETALTAIKNASRDALAEVHSLLHTIRSGTAPAAADEQPATDGADAEETGRRRTRRSARNRNSAAVERISSDGDRPEESAEAVAEPPPAPRAPAPSIGDLDDLLQRPRATGLTVNTRILGTPQQLPSVIDVAAARIVQESLTNVLRHAPGADATVTVRYTADSVDITVDNTRPTSATSRSGTSGGNGIIGMRERTHALGGALTAGPRPSGGFRVAARLPTRTPERGATTPAGTLSENTTASQTDLQGAAGTLPQGPAASVTPKRSPDTSAPGTPASAAAGMTSADSKASRTPPSDNADASPDEPRSAVAGPQRRSTDTDERSNTRAGRARR